MRIGYARVSKSEEQDTAAQISALRDSRCERIFEESASGGRWDRPELHRLLDQLRHGDIVVVWKLDRLSRSLKDLLLILERIEAARAGFQSLTEAIDTTVPAGRMMMQMLGAFAEFERAMIRERTRAGLRHAWQQGRISGRRPKLSKDQRQEVIEAVTSGRKSGAEIARIFQVHRSTVSRMIARSQLSSGTRRTESSFPATIAQEHVPVQADDETQFKSADVEATAPGHLTRQVSAAPAGE